jgi:predicted proteasome-type protease
MTDRYNALTVVLDRDIREDDAELLINAIRMLRGVLAVDPHVSNVQDHVAAARVKRELTEKLYNVMKEFGN